MPGNMNFKPKEGADFAEIKLKKKKKKPFGKPEAQEEEQDEEQGEEQDEEEGNGEEGKFGGKEKRFGGEEKENGNTDGAMNGNGELEQTQAMFALLVDLLVAKKIFTEDELYIYAENKIKQSQNKSQMNFQPTTQQPIAGPQITKGQPAGFYPGSADTNQSMGGNFGQNNMRG
jgi:hypothetical protein